MQESIQNSIEIRCSPKQLFEYVTQPWLWHEWHPSSKSASANTESLKVGDEFDEIVELQPFAPLPPRLKKSTRYSVVASDPFSFWKVIGKMKDGWLQIQYDFEPMEGGTRFIRTLKYGASGLNRLLLPFLKGKMESISVQALDNLKRKMEFESQ